MREEEPSSFLMLKTAGGEGDVYRTTARLLVLLEFDAASLVEFEETTGKVLEVLPDADARDDDDGDDGDARN